MSPDGDSLVRDVQELRDENARLKVVERELSVAIEALRSSEDRLRLAVEAAHVGIWEWDVTSDRVTWDATKHAVFGLTEGSFKGTRAAFFDLVYPDDRDGLRIALTDALEQNAPYRNEFRILRADGDIRWISNLAHVCRADDGRPLRMLGVVQDITDRRAIEKTLRASEEKFRSFVNTTSEWIWEVDTHGRVTYSNPAVEHVLGYRPEDIQNQLVVNYVHDNDKGIVQDVLRDATRHQRGWTGMVVRCRHRDGTYRHLLCHGFPLVDDSGRLIGFRGSDRDITDRLEVQQAKTDAQRMEGIGRLAGGFAHHFNNLLTVIMGNADMASTRAALGSALAFDLQLILQAAQRGAFLAKQLLTFAGKGSIRPRVMSVNAHLKEMRSELVRILGDDVPLTLQLEAELWTVDIDPSQFGIALVNLVVNAKESMPDGGVLTIATSNVSSTDRRAPRELEVVLGDYVMISVVDTGRGMAPDIAEKVFEPFFSTKERGSAIVGLGLSACYGIVAQQGGHIRLDTHPGTGTAVHVFLRRAPIPALGEPAQTAAGSRAATVLVVDDDIAVCNSVARVLRAHGYAVLKARSGAEAFDIARDWLGTIDVLLTDVVMPEMGGLQLADRMASQRPDMQVVFMSGHADGVGLQQLRTEERPFIAKPFTAGTLVNLLQDVLQQERPGP